MISLDTNSLDIGGINTVFSGYPINLSFQPCYVFFWEELGQYMKFKNVGRGHFSMRELGAQRLRVWLASLVWMVLMTMDSTL